MNKRLFLQSWAALVATIAAPAVAAPALKGKLANKIPASIPKMAPSGLTVREMLQHHARSLNENFHVPEEDWPREFSAHLNRWKDEGYLHEWVMCVVPDDKRAPGVIYQLDFALRLHPADYNWEHTNVRIVL